MKNVWVTSNKSFVGGPEIGFTLIKDQCYMIPQGRANYFAQMGWVELGKRRRKEFSPRVVVKGRRKK